MNKDKFNIDTEFKGIMGVKAYHAYHTFVRSIYYTPVCPHNDYCEAINWYDELDDKQKRKYLTIAIRDGAELKEEEIYSMLHFAKDKNGISLGKESIKELTPFEIEEILIEVACEIAKKKVFFYRKNK